MGDKKARGNPNIMWVVEQKKCMNEGHGAEKGVGK